MTREVLEMLHLVRMVWIFDTRAYPFFSDILEFTLATLLFICEREGMSRLARPKRRRFDYTIATLMENFKGKKDSRRF